MKQELIDLLMGELAPDEAAALEARISGGADLGREFADARALFALMRRGEQIEPATAAREVVLAAAARSCGPSLIEQIRQIPALFRFRLRHSFAFRVAAASLAVHLIAMLVLYGIYVRSDGAVSNGVIPRYIPLAETVRPSRGFVAKLQLRRTPHAPRLRQYGVAGQGAAIERGLGALRRTQRSDGSFGSIEDSAHAALALLAEGESSSRSPSVERVMRYLRSQVEAEARHGAVLSALVEDYALSYDVLLPGERDSYSKAIWKLIRSVENDDASREGLALARLAGFHVPDTTDLGDAQALIHGNRSALLDREPTRLRVTVVLARGHILAKREDVAAWARPLFDRALADLAAGKVSGAVVLTLQAPYRL